MARECSIHKSALQRAKDSARVMNLWLPPRACLLSDRFPVKNHNRESQHIDAKFLVDKKPSRSRAVHYQCYHRHDTIQPPVKRSDIKFFAFAVVTKGDSTQGV